MNGAFPLPCEHIAVGSAVREADYVGTGRKSAPQSVPSALEAACCCNASAEFESFRDEGTALPLPGGDTVRRCALRIRLGCASHPDSAYDVVLFDAQNDVLPGIDELDGTAAP